MHFHLFPFSSQAYNAISQEASQSKLFINVLCPAYKPYLLISIKSTLTRSPVWFQLWRSWNLWYTATWVPVAWKWRVVCVSELPSKFTCVVVSVRVNKNLYSFCSWDIVLTMLDQVTICNSTSCIFLKGQVQPWHHLKGCQNVCQTHRSEVQSLKPDVGFPKHLLFFSYLMWWKCIDIVPRWRYTNLEALWNHAEETTTYKLL